MTEQNDVPQDDQGTGEMFVSDAWKFADAADAVRGDRRRRAAEQAGVGNISFATRVEQGLNPEPTDVVFTDRFRRILNASETDARGRNHDHVGTEHLLSGLLLEEGGESHRILRTVSGRDYIIDRTNSALDFIIGDGNRDDNKTKGPVVGEIALTPRAKMAIELAMDELRRQKGGKIQLDDVQLLVGLLREGEGIAAGLLESLGVDLDKVRSEIARGSQETTS